MLFRSLLIVLSNLKDLEKINKYIEKAKGERIILINKSDLLDKDQLRKLEETIRSKKLPGITISCYNNFQLDLLKNKLIEKTGLIRVYTKEPGKKPAPNPCCLPEHSTVKDVAETIYKGFSSKIKESKVTGPSSKFPNQKVGLQHELKDLDIVEFHTN